MNKWPICKKIFLFPLLIIFQTGLVATSSSSSQTLQYTYHAGYETKHRTKIRKKERENKTQVAYMYSTFKKNTKRKNKGNGYNKWKQERAITGRNLVKRNYFKIFFFLIIILTGRNRIVVDLVFFCFE